MGIDPAGLVHISDRLLRGADGPMLRTGLQGFHGVEINQPVRALDRPDPQRLAARFAEFENAA
jgi:putative restriction endonuclease